MTHSSDEAALADMQGCDPSPESIWSGDLFGRREEAELLIGYVESVGNQDSLQEDCRGFTISVDAQYGTGKSFFLRRFAQHLKASHPVAFVDAWADDLADEPLTAIAATLKSALEPLTSKSQRVRNRWDKVSEKTGEVAKIVAKGVMKKGLGLLITGAAVEAIDEIMKPDEDDLENVKREVGGLVDGTVGKAEADLSKSGKDLMASKIADFERGQNAIRDLKASLAELVQALPLNGLKSPIVIIIDELDRCRPTYAVKLLEEIKHLFDVPGIVFVLGMNSDQLSKSISGAYGSAFDGRSYLRRFINRQYSLSVPSSAPLVDLLLRERKVDLGKLYFLPIKEGGRELEEESVGGVISRYMAAYSMTARDAFQIVDLVHTSCLVTGGRGLFMPLFLPMVFGHIKGLTGGKIPEVTNKPGWSHFYYDSAGDSGDYISIELNSLIDQVKLRAEWSIREYSTASNNGDSLAFILIDYASRSRGGAVDSSLSSYGNLIQYLGRFSDVQPRVFPEN